MEEKGLRDLIMMAAGIFIVVATLMVIVNFIYLRDRFASVHNEIAYSEKLVAQYREFNKYATGNVISNIEAFEALRYYAGDKDVEVVCDLTEIYNDPVGNQTWNGLSEYTGIYKFDTNYTRLLKLGQGAGLANSAYLLSFDRLNPLFSKLNKYYFKTYLIYNSLDPLDHTNTGQDTDYSMDQVTAIRIVGTLHP